MLFLYLKNLMPGFLHFYVNDLMNHHGLKVCVCGWVDILDEKYKAVLYLVESEGKEDKLFSVNRINNIYSLSNG